MPASDSAQSAEQAENLFAAGVVGIYSDVGPQALQELSYNFEYGATFLPRDKTFAAELGGNAIGVSRDCKHPDIAADFALFLTNEENMRDFVTAAIFLPVRRAIVGVIADHHQSWRRTNALLIYTPAQQARRVTDVAYFVRSQGPSLTSKTIQAIVHKEAPSISPYDVATMQTRMAEFASRESAMALLVAVFGALALTIAAASVYGVVSYSASLRTVEFAIRVSVGARPLDIVWLVLREAIWILAGGLCLAVPLTYFGLSLAQHQLANISFREPGTYLAAVLLLTLCTLAAAILPARRAIRMDVHGALRNS